MMTIMSTVMFLLASNETRFGHLRQNPNNRSKLQHTYISQSSKAVSDINT